MKILRAYENKISPDILIILTVSSIVLLWNLGTGSLCSWDEGLYGGVTREIIHTGNWIDLRWAGQPWSDKPPLYMWVTALFSRVLGLNELSVRLFSALAGVGTVLLTYLTALKLYSRKEAFSSALVLLSTWAFLWSSKMGMLDIPMTFFIALAICLFEYGKDNRLCLFLSPLAFTGAFLTKGMGAMLIPLILGLYILISGRIKILKDPALICGTITALALSAIWPLAAAGAYGKEFIDDYFLKHLVTRTTKAVEGHTGGLFTYFGVLPNKGRPWAGIGLALSPLLIWRTIRFREKEHLLPLVWTFTVLLLFSAVRTKLHWYVMPVYPALAIITGWGAAKLLKSRVFIMMPLLCALSLFYLATEKNIFDLDYSPETKMFAESALNLGECGKPLYAYKVSDPGLQFYLTGKTLRVYDTEKIKLTMRSGKNYVVTNRRELKHLKGEPYSIVLEEDNFVLIRSE
ncbi:MAG: phospholipid carrier-dependent glycosyltransferase [Candidatus Omnitrophica bacterium]|nr:phospholipid carrier-dependent glycosyltransferase [Candidatus Omnitrophota bacterium]